MSSRGARRVDQGGRVPRVEEAAGRRWGPGCNVRGRVALHNLGEVDWVGPPLRLALGRGTWTSCSLTTASRGRLTLPGPVHVKTKSKGQEKRGQSSTLRGVEGWPQHPGPEGLQ